MQRTWPWVISLMAGLEIGSANIGSADARFVLGHGQTSCDSWTQAHMTNAPGRLKMEDWIAGYLSAFNGFTDDPDVPDFLKDEDWDGLIGWISTYCGAHSLDNLDKAAYSLAIQLVEHHELPKQ